MKPETAYRDLLDCINGTMDHRRCTPVDHLRAYGESEYQRGRAEATAPAAYCHDCGRALHAEEVHCDDCADDLREDEQSQDGTTPTPSSEYQRGRGDALRQAAEDWSVRAGDPCDVCGERVAGACLPCRFKGCEKHQIQHNEHCPL